MNKLINSLNHLLKYLDFLCPLVDLAVRISVGIVFWRSGWVKIANMDSTVWLFKYEYHVPFLSPVFAAYLSTGAELIFSALLIIGLLGRFSAFALFVVNFMALISYPNLHDAGESWHMMWGLLLLITVFHGPGKLSLDNYLWKMIRP